MIVGVCYGPKRIQGSVLALVEQALAREIVEQILHIGPVIVSNTIVRRLEYGLSARQPRVRAANASKLRGKHARAPEVVKVREIGDSGGTHVDTVGHRVISGPSQQFDRTGRGIPVHASRG